MNEKLLTAFLCGFGSLFLAHQVGCAEPQRIGAFLPDSAGSSGGLAEGGGGSSSSSTSASFGGAGASTTCGDGIIEAPEECEGSDLGGRTCETLGFLSGELACTPACGFDVSACAPPETCTNALDDDGDGSIDCEDDDCRSAEVCTDPCTFLELALPPSSALVMVGTNIGRASVYSPSCGGPTSGPEMIFRMTPNTAGTLRLIMDSMDGADLSLSVTTKCGDVTTELACSNHPKTHPFWLLQEQVVFETVPGTTYYVVVDGATPGAAGGFSIDFASDHIEDCYAFVDLDGDGRALCDDPDCQTSPLCAPGDGVAGTKCSSSTDCASASKDPVCIDASMGFPDGYCSQFCDLGAPDCFPGSTCVDIGVSLSGVCLKTCSSNADCRAGFACSDEKSSVPVCAPTPEPNCTNLVDDDGDNLVDCDDPNCKGLPACTQGAGAVGSPCAQANECAANGGDPICLGGPVFTAEGGYCSQFCAVGSDECGPGALCSNWLGWPNWRGNCFKTCESNADCRMGYQCADIAESSKVCIF